VGLVATQLVENPDQGVVLRKPPHCVTQPLAEIGARSFGQDGVQSGIVCSDVRADLLHEGGDQLVLALEMQIEGGTAGSGGGGDGIDGGSFETMLFEDPQSALEEAGAGGVLLLSPERGPLGPSSCSRWRFRLTSSWRPERAVQLLLVGIGST
jgi:hypothetical protein